MRRRLEPFLDLLDARYLPLLFAGVPQAYTVYAWLISGGSPEWVAQMGGVGFEFVYVGSIAWAERGAGWKAARGPAITALAFSVAVAVAHYGAAQGALAALHAGFPLVAYFYTLLMHTRQAAPSTAADEMVASLQAELAQTRITLAERQALPAPSSSDDEPEIIRLKERDNLSFAQIGDRLGITRQAAWQRYKDAKRVKEGAQP
jgi:hypothetical protein